MEAPLVDRIDKRCMPEVLDHPHETSAAAANDAFGQKLPVAKGRFQAACSARTSSSKRAQLMGIPEADLPRWKARFSTAEPSVVLREMAEIYGANSVELAATVVWGWATMVTL